MKKHPLINLSFVFCLCLLTLFSGCCVSIGDVFKAKYERTENVYAPVEGVVELCVEADVGSITVTGADVTDCNITAKITVKARTKEKARELAEQVRMEPVRSGDTLTIKARKPSELKSRSLSVAFKIIAPKHLNLNCSAHVGTLKVSDIKGRIRASVNVGSISCSQVVGDVNLESNIGSIEVKYSDVAPAACDADITTNVGSIEFTGPPQLSAQLNASTNVGSITTSKPVTVVGKLGRSIKGTIGSGEGKINLRTNVGSIEVK